MFQPRALLAQYGHECGMLLIDNQCLATGIVQRIGDLRRAPAEVGRHDHSARPGRCQIDLKIMIAVEGQHGNARTLDQFLRSKTARKPCCPFVEFSEGLAP